MTQTAPRGITAWIAARASRSSKRTHDMVTTALVILAGVAFIAALVMAITAVVLAVGYDEPRSAIVGLGWCLALLVLALVSRHLFISLADAFIERLDDREAGQ